MVEYLESFKVLPTLLHNQQRVEIKTNKNTYVDVWEYDIVKGDRFWYDDFSRLPKMNLKKWCKLNNVNSKLYFNLS